MDKKEELARLQKVNKEIKEDAELDEKIKKEKEIAECRTLWGRVKKSFWDSLRS